MKRGETEGEVLFWVPAIDRITEGSANAETDSRRVSDVYKGPEGNQRSWGGGVRGRC